VKITPEDMDAVRELMYGWRRYNTNNVTDQKGREQIEINLALFLVGIWDRGYAEALKDNRILTEDELRHECPYTFSHTKHWCGYDGCREG